MASAVLVRVVWITLAALWLARGSLGAETFSESFLNKRHNQAMLSVIGDGRFIEPTDDGLEIHVQPPATENAGFKFVPQLIGDFVVTVKASLLDVPKPLPGHGTGIAISLEDGQTYGASIQRVVFSDNRQSLVSHHFTIDAGHYDHKSKETSFAPNNVTLQIERKGSRLIYRAAEKGGELQEIDQADFTANPIPITLVYAQTGGGPNEVRARIESFEITADELLRPGQRSKIADSKKVLILLVVALGIAAVATGAFLLRRKRPKPKE
jgi:hypothetical protein